MNHSIQQIPIQQLNNGQFLEITKHTFEFSVGPKIYLQANLHGAEIFGTFLLGRIIQKLKLLTSENILQNNIIGSLIIIPTANPIAAQNTSYDSINGRWNPISGTNWNRIFETKKFKSKNEMNFFYQNQLEKENLSIEEKLAANLMLLSHDSYYIVDIHTTGRDTLTHIFSHPDSISFFQKLEPELNIFTTDIPPSPAFENANVWPLLDSEKPAVSCTWEVSCHNIIDLAEIETQEERLWNWLISVWSQETVQKIKKLSIKDTDCHHLIAPFGGYFSWTAKKGQIVKKDQAYATFYQPCNDIFIQAKAEFDFILIAKYGIGAISQGQQIGLIGKIEA